MFSISYWARILVQVTIYRRLRIGPETASTKHLYTFIQCRHNVIDVGPALYKYYTNVLCLLGMAMSTNQKHTIYMIYRNLYENMGPGLLHDGLYDIAGLYEQYNDVLKYVGYRSTSKIYFIDVL